jgi:hypothetical protein
VEDIGALNVSEIAENQNKFTSVKVINTNN